MKGRIGIGILSASALGGLLSLAIGAEGQNLYNRLSKPYFAPPIFVFSVVWLLLSVLMGISSAMIAEKKSTCRRQVRVALQLYGAVLLLCFCFGLWFFKMGAILLSFFWLLFLCFLFVLTAYCFYKIRPAAGLLLLPLGLWIGYCTYLTLTLSISL